MLNFSEKKACVSRHSLSVLFMCGQFWEARLHLWKNVVANLHLDWIHSQEPLTWANAETEGFPSHHLHVQGSLRDWSPGPKIANFFFFSIYFVPGTVYVLLKCRASLIAQLVNHLPAMQETQVQFLDLEWSSGDEMETHSSILAWRIPWTEEPGGHSHAIARAGHNLVTKPLPPKCINLPNSHISTCCCCCC